MKPRPAPSRRRDLLSDALVDAIKERGTYATATAAGLAPSVVARFITGERGLTLDSVDVIAQALGLELREVRRGRVKIAK